MVVAFYFRLHLAYFPRPVVAIFARPEQWIPKQQNTAKKFDFLTVSLEFGIILLT